MMNKHIGSHGLHKLGFGVGQNAQVAGDAYGDEFGDDAEEQQSYDDEFGFEDGVQQRR